MLEFREQVVGCLAFWLGIMMHTPDHSIVAVHWDVFLHRSKGMSHDTLCSQFEGHCSDDNAQN